MGITLLLFSGAALLILAGWVFKLFVELLRRPPVRHVRRRHTPPLPMREAPRVAPSRHAVHRSAPFIRAR